MTRRHMEAFAEEIRIRSEAEPYGRTAGEQRAALTEAADVVAVVMKRFNPRFDRDRFYFACFPSEK